MIIHVWRNWLMIIHWWFTSLFFGCSPSIQVAPVGPHSLSPALPKRWNLAPGVAWPLVASFGHRSAELCWAVLMAYDKMFGRLAVWPRLSSGQHLIYSLYSVVDSFPYINEICKQIYNVLVKTTMLLMIIDVIDDRISTWLPLLVKSLSSIIFIEKTYGRAGMARVRHPTQDIAQTRLHPPIISWVYNHV